MAKRKYPSMSDVAERAGKKFVGLAKESLSRIVEGVTGKAPPLVERELKASRSKGKSRKKQFDGPPRKKKSPKGKMAFSSKKIYVPYKPKRKRKYGAQGGPMRQPVR